MRPITKRHRSDALISIAIVILVIAAAIGILRACFLIQLYMIPASVPYEEQDTENSAEVSTEQYIADMNLDEKVYQMFFVTPESLTGVEQVIGAGAETRDALEKYPVGGIIYFEANLNSRAQVNNMIISSQEFTKIPLFIGVDEEGGRVSRLSASGNLGIQKGPSMSEIAKSGDTEKAYEAGASIGKNLKELGFNMDFAPVADVLVNPDNAEIGDRSFGDDPKVVGDMASRFADGLGSEGIIATLKHFPGHGSTYTDSHTGYSESYRTEDELRECEFQAFSSAMGENTGFVLVSNMTLVNAGSDGLPCSMSHKVISEYLKSELGYEGIVITDSLSMGAITDVYTTEEAAVKAVMAGADMLLMPYDLKRAHDAIVDAVERGDISENQIDDSVRNIIYQKTKYGIIKE